MFLPLTLSLLLPCPAAVPAAPDPPPPPIKVWLSDDVFRRGDRARIHVKTTQDGYLVVLRVDADGHIRVLFPVDPGDSNFVRGGRKLEIRGRGDREAFTVDEREGSGTVLAARSSTPLKFDEFAHGGGGGGATGTTTRSPPRPRTATPKGRCSTSRSAWPAITSITTW